MAFSQLPDPLPPTGFALPIDRIDSSFRILGFVPGYSHNDVSCRLVLFPSHLEIKVMSTSHHEYTALRQVGYRPAGFLRSERLELEFGGADQVTYYVKPSSGAVSREFLRFCHERGLPLSEAAQQRLNEG